MSSTTRKRINNLLPQVTTELFCSGMNRKTAIVIGSGIGGIACGIRLQSLGFNTTIIEKLDSPGGRALVHKANGFVFDMGPTVLTVPHFIEELFALERDKAMLGEPDFPIEILDENKRIKEGISGGPHTSRYVELRPILPFYRIYFQDGTYFDYDCDPENTRRQIAELAPEDVEGYDRFHAAAKRIFDRGFIELGYTYFGDISAMIKVVPDLFKLNAVRTLFSFVKQYFKSDKMRRVFSYETLLIGGNPQKVPAIYAMIHFVEKTWGVHFAMGGTGELVKGFARKFEDIGGNIIYSTEVHAIQVDKIDGKSTATGVTLSDGKTLNADVVVSNSDYANTYLKLIEPSHRKLNRDSLVKFRKQSMSLVVIYFGFTRHDNDPPLQHHNIILGPRYEELLTDIFERKILADDFSQYLHLPTITDASLAPEGHHAAYTLVPVPNNLSKIDWETKGEAFVNKVLMSLETMGHIPNLMKRIVYRKHITPAYFQNTLNAYLGNGFGVEPVMAQSAYFRPHNRSEDVKNLYLVGQGTQPGGGTPSVMMSAKMTARVIAEDYRIDEAIVKGVPVPT